METTKVVNGNLEVTTTDVKIVTKTKEELVGEKAEMQTKIDHLNVDLSATQVKIARINELLKMLE